MIVLAALRLLDVEGFEVPISSGGLETRKRLGHRVHRVFTLPLGVLEEDEVPGLEPFVVGAVRCDGLMIPVSSQSSRRALRSRRVVRGQSVIHAVRGSPRE